MQVGSAFSYPGLKCRGSLQHSRSEKNGDRSRRGREGRKGEEGEEGGMMGEEEEEKEVGEGRRGRKGEEGYTVIKFSQTYFLA